jgi:hypothetical protein
MSNPVLESGRGECGPSLTEELEKVRALLQSGDGEGATREFSRFFSELLRGGQAALAIELGEKALPLLDPELVRPRARNRE